MTNKSKVNGKIIFSSPEADPVAADILPQQVFDKEQFVPEAPAVEGDTLLDAALQPKKANWWLRFGLFGAMAAATWESVSWLTSTLAHSPLTGMVYSAIVVCLFVALLKLVVSELSKLNRLRQTQKLQGQANTLDLQASDGAYVYCQQLAKLSKQLDSPGYIAWQNQLSDSHNNQEVLDLYRHHVLSVQDAQAKQAVTKWSGEAALLVAISPLALVDMLIILWRNSKMIEAVAHIYGIELGYLSRLKLFKMVLTNMVFAAGVEVATDLGSDILGAEVAGLVSARAAQGVGAGLITARLGFKAIQLCRPVPWLKEERPKAKDVRMSLIQKLKSSLKSVV
ncbi:TIGR01620 family protein [Motilimonas sp. 1_MG-2023]|uniref:YcjF family protein n=1 Tax=Motilimonas sp. 1_MG-2023 TaxID=3062672 RepID=UPI0026E40705|nr:TIGR01620 family protein [Motilimonas sp. 1_MG-2023]MDO6526280.1 TIGR01620 family protein [Motilimonas sp. 1_MG-2023]